MPNAINPERKLLIMLIYVIAISFMVAGVSLFSVFNGDDFLYLTIKFIIISLVPIAVFYQIDYIYTEVQHENPFVLSHLEWITHNYIMYLVMFIANKWVIKPLLALADINFNFIFLIIFIWLTICYLRGFNRMLLGLEAPKSKINFTISKIKAYLKRKG